ncbi:MAG: DUF4296 domain-containing protein [Mucilaginibacter sp.]
MHKYKILFFSVLLFLTACGIGTPKGIIDPDKMVSLLTEVHIVDGILYNGAQTPDSLYKYGMGRYLALFKKFKTDSAQFRKSYRYYTTNPEELLEIYQAVEFNLKQKSDSLNKLQQQQVLKDAKRRSDSLARLPKPAPGQQPQSNQTKRNYLPAKRPVKNAVPPNKY